jgi:hypothetical protein
MDDYRPPRNRDEDGNDCDYCVVRGLHGEQFVVTGLTPAQCRARGGRCVNINALKR